MQQYIRAVANVRRCRELTRTVTDASAAWYKDHSNRAKVRDVLRIMTSATGKFPGRQAKLRRGIRDHATDPRIGRRWLRCAGLFEPEPRASKPFDQLHLRLNLLEKHADLVEVEISKLETRHDSTWNNVIGAWERLDPANRPDLPAGN